MKTNMSSVHSRAARGIGIAAVILATNGIAPAARADDAASRAAAPRDARAAHQNTATGHVRSVGQSEIVLRRAAQPDLRLAVDDATSVAIDGRSASTAELREGNEVRESYQDGGGVAKAIRIEAKRERGEAMRTEDGQAVRVMSPDDPEWDQVHQGG